MKQDNWITRKIKLLFKILLRFFRGKDVPEYEMQMRWFSSCNEGDLIWASMPMSKKELKKIEDSHRVRPYLIVSKNDKGLVGYQCSSKESIRLKGSETVVLEAGEPLQKKTWINLTKEYQIPIKNLRGIPHKINLIKRSEIETRIASIYKEKNFTQNLLNGGWKREKGDMIYYQFGYWIVLKHYYKKLTLGRIYDQKGKNLIPIKIAGNRYYFDKQNILVIDEYIRTNAIVRASKHEMNVIANKLAKEDKK